MLALDRYHFIDKAADHRRRVARSGTDLEHPVARPDPGGLDHQGYNVGLRDGLPRFDRQRVVAIGEMCMVVADERFARHGHKGLEDRLLANPPATELLPDHRLAP